MKRVLHLSLLPLLTGVQNVMLQILEAIEDDGYEIYVASAPNGPLIKVVEDRGWKHIVVPSLVREINPVKDLKAMVELYNILKDNKIDILHTHSSKTGVLGRVIGTFAKVPRVIHTSHGYPFNNYQKLVIYGCYFFIERFAGMFCDKMVTVNSEDADFANKKLKIPKNKVAYIPNGATPLEVEPNRDSLASKSEITIGSMSRFWQQKNMIKSVEAAIEACKVDSRLKFVFVGDGEDLSICQKMVNDSNLQAKISFPGWSSDRDRWLKSFDVFILFSLWEGLPLGILEAMAHGLPIIASDIKGNRELVNSANGYLVSPNDIDGLKNILIKLFDNKADLISKGKESLKKVRDEYSMNKFNKNYKNLYRELTK